MTNSQTIVRSGYLLRSRSKTSSTKPLAATTEESPTLYIKAATKRKRSSRSVENALTDLSAKDVKRAFSNAEDDDFPDDSDEDSSSTCPGRRARKKRTSAEGDPSLDDSGEDISPKAFGQRPRKESEKKRALSPSSVEDDLSLDDDSDEDSSPKSRRKKSRKERGCRSKDANAPQKDQKAGKERRPPLKAETKVPMPSGPAPEFPRVSEAKRPPGQGGLRKQNSLIRRKAKSTVLRYLKYAPIIQIDTTLEACEDRVKNSEKDILDLQPALDHLAKQSPIGTSAICVDRTGRRLHFQIANRMVEPIDTPATSSHKKVGKGEELEGQAESKKARSTSRSAAWEKFNAPFPFNGRKPISVATAQQQYSEEKFRAAFAEGKDIQRDAIPSEHLDSYLYAQQLFHARNQPKYKDSDGRHNRHQSPHRDPRVMRYSTSLLHPLSSESDLHGWIDERCGVTHLVHAWKQQGHPGRLFASSDITGGSTLSDNAAQDYFRATDPLAIWLSVYFEFCFPEYFRLYRKAFQSGVWIKQDRGPWLGRANIWKLQTTIHQDGCDAGPAASIPLGYFTGGHLEMPDLMAKFTYDVGHIALFMSGALYHQVSAWKPAPVPARLARLGITPGRVGQVFFFPRDSLAILKDKEPLWFHDTAGGQLPANATLRDDEPKTTYP